MKAKNFWPDLSLNMIKTPKIEKKVNKFKSIDEFYNAVMEKQNSSSISSDSVSSPASHFKFNSGKTYFARKKNLESKII